MYTKTFSPTKTITKKNLADVPGDKPGVYRIKSSSDKLLYVGKAKGGRLDDRIWEHRGRFHKGTKFQYRTTASKDAAERLEKQEIRKYLPLRNRKK